MAAILLAGPEHIDQIVSLNKRYLLTNLPKGKTGKGFIRIEYSEAEILEIIRNGEIAIALSGTKVQGYFLIGKRTDNPRLEYQRKGALSLSGMIGASFEKIGYGCQVCIDENYRGLGLYKDMISFIAEKVNGKYDFLLSTISTENRISLQNSLAIGWKPINSSKEFDFYIYQIK